MGPFVFAWLLGEGIIVYRSVKRQHVPPGPGQLLYSSGLFVVLALLAEAPRARFLATALAYGFDIAALMNLFPPVTGPKTGPGTPGAPPKGAATTATVAQGWVPGLIPPDQILPGNTPQGTLA